MRTVELSDEVYERAERAAAERGMPVNEWINQMVDRAFLPCLPKETLSIG